MRIIAAILSLCLFLAASPASAQGTTYTLDGDSGWVQTDAPTPGTDEAMLADCRRAIAEGQPGRARDVLKPWVKRHRRDGHPYMPEALLLLGDAKRALGNEYQALFEYEEVITFYPESPQFVQAVSRELDIAIRYANGLKRRMFWGLVRWGSTRSLTEELLLRVHERMPGSELGERALLELADFYYRRRDLVMAADAYDLFIINYPASFHRVHATKRQILANIALFKGPRYDGAGIIEASRLIEDFRDDHPLEAQEAGFSESLLARLDESAGAQMLETADWYFDQGDEVSGRFMLKRLLAKHPRTVAAQRARELMEEQGWLDPAPQPAETEVGDASSVDQPIEETP